MEILKYSEAHISELIEDLKTLVSIPSVLKDQPENKTAPFGEDNVLALSTFLKMGEDAGLSVLNIDNIVGYVEYKSSVKNAETLGILCHLDVVPAPLDNWKTNPFEATIVDGKIYGRGTADDKGPLLSVFYALKAIKEEGIQLQKNVRIIVGTDEESGSRCLMRYLEKEKEPEIGFSPDADFPVIYGEKGIASFDFIGKNTDPSLISLDSGDVYNVVPDKAVIVAKKNLKKEFLEFLNVNHFTGEFKEDGGKCTYTLRGKRAHAMNPSAGVNALVNLCTFASNYFDTPIIKFLAHYAKDSFGEALNVAYDDYEMHKLTINYANAKMDGDVIKSGINIRYPVRFDYDNFVNTLTKKANEYGLDFIELGNSSPHYIPKESALVSSLLASYRLYSGDTTTPPITIGGGTYARHLHNAVAFGLMFPGEEDCMHQANEYIKIDILKKGIAIYYDAILRLAR